MLGRGMMLGFLPLLSRVFYKLLKSLSWNLIGKVPRTSSLTRLFARVERSVLGKMVGRDVMKPYLGI